MREHKEIKRDFLQRKDECNRNRRRALIKQKTRHQRLLLSVIDSCRSSIEDLIRFTRLNTLDEVFNMLLELKRTWLGVPIVPPKLDRASLFKGLHSYGVVLTDRQLGLIWPSFFPTPKFGDAGGSENTQGISVSNWRAFLTGAYDFHFARQTDDTIKHAANAQVFKDKRIAFDHRRISADAAEIISSWKGEPLDREDATLPGVLAPGTSPTKIGIKKARAQQQQRQHQQRRGDGITSMSTPEQLAQKHPKHKDLQNVNLFCPKCLQGLD